MTRQSSGRRLPIRPALKSGAARHGDPAKTGQRTEHLESREAFLKMDQRRGNKSDDGCNAHDQRGKPGVDLLFCVTDQEKRQDIPAEADNGRNDPAANPEAETRLPSAAAHSPEQALQLPSAQTLTWPGQCL